MITAKRLIPGSALTGSLVTYYTVPPGTMTIIKEIIFCNTDTVARTISANIIPLSGSAAIANQIFDTYTLKASETKIFSLSSVMPSGSFLQALASSAAVVSMNVSGYEIT